MIKRLLLHLQARLFRLDSDTINNIPGGHQSPLDQVQAMKRELEQIYTDEFATWEASLPDSHPMNTRIKAKIHEYGYEHIMPAFCVKILL